MGIRRRASVGLDWPPPPRMVPARAQRICSTGPARSRGRRGLSACCESGGPDTGAQGMRRSITPSSSADPEVACVE